MLGSQWKAPKLTLLSYIEQLFHKESIETIENVGQNVAFNCKCQNFRFSTFVENTIFGQTLD